MNPLKDLTDDLDKEEVTPIMGSGTYPVFSNAAKELSEKLSKINSIEAKELIDRLSFFEKRFKSWGPENYPTEQERKKTISDFLIEHKNILKFLDSLEK